MVLSVFAQAAEWHAPLEINEGISATFGEYRKSHFHSGIDFKTRGKVGFKVYAVGDGHIYRLNVTKRGYGKAVYIKHTDGKISVYAHLSQFEDKKLGLETTLKEVQAKKGKYPGDIYLNQPLYVSKGQVIGYSGESGEGLPHLHFELRDENNIPVNPFLYGFTFNDNLPPIFKSLIITPKNSKSTLMGQYSQIEFPFHEVNNTFTTNDTPVLKGYQEIMVNVYDRVGANNRCGIYKIDFFVDDQLNYSCEFEKFPFSKAYKVGTIYEYDYTRLTPTSFYYKLFRQAGNDLPMSSKFNVSDGILDTMRYSNGEHKLRIIAWDYSGNKSEAIVKVIFNQEPILSNFSIKEVSEGKLQLRAVSYDSDSEENKGQMTKRVDFEASYGGGKNWELISSVINPLSFDAQFLTSDWITDWELPADQSLSKVLVRARAFDGYQYSPWVQLPLVSLNKQSPSLHSKNDEIEVPALKLDIKNHGNFVLLKVISNKILYTSPILTVRQHSGSNIKVHLKQVDEKTYIGTYDLIFGLDGTATVKLIGIDLEGKESYLLSSFNVTSIDSDTGGCISTAEASLEIPPKALYSPAFLDIQPDKELVSDKLPMVSRAYDFNASSTPFDKLSKVNIKISEEIDDLQKVGLYAWDKIKNKWSFKGAELDAEKKIVSARVRHLSVYALLADYIPPKIANVYPKIGSKISDSTPTISAIITDEGMGINEEKTTIMIDGQIVDAEYDPDRHKISYTFCTSLETGKHSLCIEAEDMAENQAAKITGFFYIVGK